MSDPTVSRLSEAARWIEEEEVGVRRLRRSVRLAPLRDISADIQRASTPYPKIKPKSAFDTQPEAAAKAGQHHKKEIKEVADANPPNLWPWFAGAEDAEEKERDLWANSTDPFALRARPTMAEAAHIEEEDIRRVQVEEHTTLPYIFSQRSQQRRHSVWRLAFGALVILALMALTIDGFLLSFAFNHTNHPLVTSGGPPTLSLSANVVSVGENVSLHLTHFTRMTTVVLTHDVEETLLTTTNSSSLTIGADGQADALFTVSNSWGPGFHLIVAENVTTRDTASAMLQINGEGPSRPPHLLLDSSLLSLGEAVQGADTIQPLALANSGSGAITWSASSDQPWLLVAPQQGTFGAGQTISVAAQRSNLQPGDYKGTITISTSVGAPEQVPVTMTVNPLPPNAGPMISLVPPLLSFATMDGVSTPETQVLTLNNPGQQTLYWSLSGKNMVTTTMQSAPPPKSASHKTGLSAYGQPGNDTSWLSTDQTSGSLAPGQTAQIHITVRSQNLLPGAYMGMLTFSSSRANGAYDTPQVMNVALTVQPHCGLVTSTGNLAFTAVSGQSNPSSHALSLNATSSCSSPALNWQAQHSASWITINPANGQVRGTNSSVTSIGVNTAGLAPGKYTGLVTFLTEKSTQTVTVELNLQPRPAPSAPIMGASPLSLNFSNIQGQPNPTGQVVTITNNGGSPLKWHTNISQLDASWIAATPTGGTVPPGQTEQVTVNISAMSLTPGNYTGQLTFNGTDTNGVTASGSPQTITVSLVVQPPCTLAQPSASTLVFPAIAGAANPTPQIVTLMGTGSCAWPLHWSTSISPAASWLTLTPSSSLLNTTSQQGSITVSVNTSGLVPGTYTTQVKISAVDSAGTQAQNSPQTFSVTLTVSQPCTLQQLPSGLALSASQGQAAPATQTLNLSETGSCGGGVAWTATGDAGSSSWLSLSAASGTDTGSGSSIVATASAGSLLPATYTGQITISASNHGVVLQDSPQVIHVTFQVNGYNVSGKITACGGPSPNCTVSSGLANATVSLISNGTTIATTSADALGNFTFANIPLGSYTVSASGSSSNMSYTGTTTITVNSDTSGVNVQTFAS